MWVTPSAKLGFWPHSRGDAPPVIPLNHRGCGLWQSTPHFLPAPGRGISFQWKARHAGARGHAGRVPAQSQDAARAYAGGRGRRTSCPRYLPASPDPAGEISHLKITRRAEVLCWLNRKSPAEISGTSHMIEATCRKCLNLVHCIHITGGAKRENLNSSWWLFSFKGTWKANIPIITWASG